jgi:hypothetical protein
MKVLIIAILMFCLISCSKKSDDIIYVSSIDQLNGTWKWESTCGGFTGDCGYSSNLHYAVIDFFSNGTFIEKHNDTIYQQANYTVIKSNDTSGELVLDNSDYKMSITIVNNRLEMCRGDLIDTYKKIK